MWEEQATDPQLCVFCNKTTADPKSCPQCKVPYCSEECSYADRHLHQFLCTRRDVYRPGNENSFRIAVESAVLYTPDLMNEMDPRTSVNEAEASASGHALLQRGRNTKTTDPNNEDVAGSQSAPRGGLPDNLISLPKEELVKRLIEQSRLLEQSEIQKERLRRELEVTRVQAQRSAMEASIIRKEHASCGSGEKEKLLEEKARVLGESLGMALQALHVAKGFKEPLEHEEADRKGKSGVARNKIPTPTNSMMTVTPVTAAVMKTSTPVMAVTTVTPSVTITSTPVMAVTTVTPSVTITSTPVMAVTTVTPSVTITSTPVMAVTPVTSSVTTSTPVMAGTPVIASPVKTSTRVMAGTPVTTSPVKTSTRVLAGNPVTASPVKTSTRVMADTLVRASSIKTSTPVMAGTPVIASPVKTSTRVMVDTPVTASSIKTSTHVMAGTPTPAPAVGTPVTCSSSGISSAVSQASAVHTATQPGAAKSQANDVISGPPATAMLSERSLQNGNTEGAVGLKQENSRQTSQTHDLFRKHPGQLEFICRQCFFMMDPACISFQKQDGGAECTSSHRWDADNIILAHCSMACEVHVILNSTFKHKTAIYIKCPDMDMCGRVAVGHCRLAHSSVEYDVWCYERDSALSLEQIQQDYSKLATQDATAWQQAVICHRAKLPVDGDTTEHASPTPVGLRRTPAAFVEDLFNKHQGHMFFICHKCYYEIKPCRISSKHAQKGSCVDGHLWCKHGNLLVYRQDPQGPIEPIQKIPFIKWNSFFLLCYYKKFCRYVGLKGGCKFAHSAIECEVWCMERDTGWSQKQIQLEYCRLASQKDIEEASSRDTPTTGNAANPRGGQLAVSASYFTSSIPSNVCASPYYCQYCNVQCQSERQLQQHNTSNKHKVNIFSDNEHQWNHRPPPWGWDLQVMQLCERQRRGTCLFGDKDGVFNHCSYAHSQSELDEWLERADWRQIKQAMAKEQHLLSYMDDTLDEYQSASQPTEVMSEDTTDALIDCSTPLRAYSDQKKAEFSWEFTVTHKADLALKIVALLHNYDRAHFSLQGRNLPHRCQQAQGDQLLAQSDPKTYRVKITFFANLFGSFNQSVVFDFGTRPITRRRLHIDVGTTSDQDKVDKLRKKLHMDMWTPANRTLIYFNEEYKENTKRSFVSKLLSKYPVPTTDEVVNLRLDGELNRYNYVRKMHQLLQLEELAQSAIITRTFSQVTIRILDKITDDGLVLPHPGELFAVVPLEEHLSDETEAGQLILNKTRSVLLASNASKQAYEAFIVNRDVFDYEGKRGDCIYLVLSPRCCKEMELKAGESVPVVLQFQLDRETLCYMHYALDKLDDTMHVFPNFSRTEYLPACSISLSTHTLNANQMRIVKHVMSQGRGYNPPLVVYGPFGTGKTETIAQASMLLLTSKPNARILICTHSNRAADLYITRYFHKFIASLQERKPQMLRIYFEGRRFATVDATVLDYCLRDENNAFCIPDEETLKEFHLVIATVMTSVQLTRLGMRGHFTHIFIDEAGQALECETLIPFTLANENTCIVLAGDHQQMSPIVYSPEARTFNFHHSILQRLFYFYNSIPDCEQNSRLLTIMLVDNYRTKEEILRFISSVYYGGPESLKCRSTQPDVAHIRPMYFYRAKGEEALDAGSASYYNMAEVQEVADRMVEIFDHWPDEWGERKAEAIAVVSQYHAQVTRIRNKLRSLRRPELRHIEVHRMQNLQGCEFRAICISTVRTYHLIENDRRFMNSGREYGFLSDNKLLNSALTRSQNAILVVGDPVALCSVGKCQSIWRSYLGHCQDLGTIYPTEVTCETVQMEVKDLTVMASPDLRNVRDHCDEASVFDEKAGTTFDSVSHGGFFEKWSLDYMIEPDFIIQQLSKMVAYDNRQHQNNIPTEPEQIEENTFTLGNQGSARRLLSSTNWDDDFTEDDISDTENLYDDDQCQYTLQDLEERLRLEPKKFKRCILKIESSDRMHGKTFDNDIATNMIKIATRRRCGHAFSDDIVVVEILETDTQKMPKTNKVEDSVPQGRVIGILKRAIDPKYRMFVCRVDPSKPDIMIPINRGIPVLKNLQSGVKKKGHVCVYTFTWDKRIVHHHLEPLDPSNPNEKVFIARYLKWEYGHPSPLCIVVAVQKAGNTLTNGMIILNIEHYIDRQFRNDIGNEKKKLYKKLAKGLRSKRMDMREKLVFTVDPPESCDLDDALSITTLPDGEACIGIHISDVSYYVNKDSYIEKRAFERGTSYYPVNANAVHMIPDWLATDICSLLPNKDRLTLSLLIYVSTDGATRKVECHRSVIRSKHRLTYGHVEDILKDNTKEPEDMLPSIFQLHSIAAMWRKERLGPTGLLDPVDEDNASTPAAHLMVEELMIKANTVMADWLLEYPGNCVPLKIQPAPSEQDMNTWREQHFFAASLCPLLTRDYLPEGQRCQCRSVCSCVPIFDRESLVSIASDVWAQIRKSISCDDMDSLHRLLLDPTVHPQQAIAAFHLQMLHGQSSYVCAQKNDPETRKHCSLQVSAYTQFTSPIRRYIDLIVHRLIIARIENRSSPYSESELVSICEHCTQIGKRSNQYERAMRCLALADKLQKQPMVIYPVIESIDDTQIRLKFPALKKEMPASAEIISLNALQPAEMPTIMENAQLLLKWQCRLYDTKADQNHIYNHPGVLSLDEPHVVKVERELWQKLVGALLSSGMINLPDSFHSMRTDVRDMSSEQREGISLDHFCQFQLYLKQSSVVRVQITSAMHRGMIMPRLQLFSVTPRLDFCLEHRKNPLDCFTNPVTRQASKINYRSVGEYSNLWLAVLSLEAANTAVDEGEGAYIHNVSIRWAKKNGRIQGHFQFTANFVRDRQLDINAGDLLCIRYHDQQIASLNTEETEPAELVTWVGHFNCIFAKTDDETHTVWIELQQSAVPIPSRLFESVADALATVEWLPVNIPLRIMQTSVKSLKQSSELVQNIALNKVLRPLDLNIFGQKANQPLMKIPNTFSANNYQEAAIRYAMNHPFALIQGPPGTGKTVTGVRLACIMVHNNRRACDLLTQDNVGPQLLYCGPSNKSVDVITEYLLRLGPSCPNILRIYGQRKERQEFPLPVELIAPRRKRLQDSAMAFEHKDVTLHHIIRRDGMPYSERIRSYDLRFGDPTKLEEITPQEIEDYKKLVMKAKKEVVKKAEILLCTCTTAAVSPVRDTANVVQVIIDECSMSMEPESMSPLVRLKPRQITLIGDHKQLRPIVVNQRAGRLGLQTSLFERYCDKARMLTIQYRMHDTIATFPSYAFYEGQLRCGTTTQKCSSSLDCWPGGPGYPQAFIHVMGHEEMLSVATSEGNVKSVSNKEEIHQAVHVVNQLVQKYNIPEQTIAVLSQYRAQCAEMSNVIRSKGYKGITVTTVVESQGSEWEYVVLSCVRSLPRCEIEENPTRGWCSRNVGFIADPNQMNVAITRAKKGLVIIGNKYLLRSSAIWEEYLKHLQGNRAVVDAGQFMAQVETPHGKAS